MELSTMLQFLSGFLKIGLPENKENLLKSLKSVKWKNEVAAKHEAYKPTFVEHIANIVTHGVSIPIALWCMINLVKSSKTQVEYSAAVVYGCVLVGLFTVSTTFHTFACIGRHRRLHEIFHRGDRAMIYLFIAGSYTPWLMLCDMPHDGFGFQLRWAIWPISALGILYQQLFHEKYKWLETVFYLVIGIVPGSVAALEMIDDSGLAELKLGGLVYVVGVLFFKCDGRIPLAHAIWHVHVVAGALIHYFAVMSYLYEKEVLDSLAHENFISSEL